jgi:hypothetical protein
VQVTQAGGVLRAQIVTDPPADLEHWEFDTFRSRPADGRPAVAVSFVPDGAGNITGVRVANVTFVRTRPSR